MHFYIAPTIFFIITSVFHLEDPTEQFGINLKGARSAG